MIKISKIIYQGDCGQEVEVEYFHIQDYCNKCKKIHLFKVKTKKRTD